MPPQYPHIVRLMAAFALASFNVAAEPVQAPVSKTLLAYGAEFSRLYAVESGNALAYRKGVAQAEGIARYESLRRRLHRLNGKRNQAAANKILEAMVVMELAAARHNLQSLLDLKAAKDLLEQCCETAAAAEKAAAHALLGHIYFKVPPDPLGFGDKRLARIHWEEALALDPDGAWPNYQYGVYLAELGEAADARRYLEKAKAGKLPASLDGVAAVLQADVEAELKKLGEQPTSARSDRSHAASTTRQTNTEILSLPPLCRANSTRD